MSEQVATWGPTHRQQRKRRAVMLSSQGSTSLSAINRYKDASMCQGLYNQAERDRQIRAYNSCLSPNERTVQVNVSTGSASESAESPSKFFVCFGFSANKPFYMPGTIVDFVDGAEASLKAIIAGTVVAEGRRPNEYAVAICFQDPLPSSSYVAALFNHTFNVTEVDSVQDMCASIFDFVKHYKGRDNMPSGEHSSQGPSVYGDVPECLRGNEAALNSCIQKFDMECRAMNQAAAQACRRERRRGMHEYFKALMYVDGLRHRGIWLKPSQQQQTVAKPSSPEDIDDDSEGSRHSNVRSSSNCCCRHDEKDKAKEDTVQITRKNGTDYAMQKCNSRKLWALSDQFIKKREDCIAKAHEKFCAGFIGMLSENPLGVKELWGMYDNYLRLEGGAEVEMPDC